jgi:hypothetical protein
MFIGLSRSVFPAMLIGGFLIIIGVTYSLEMDFGQIVGGWAENFGQSMGSWGENFGRSIGSWGESVGEWFSNWGLNFGRSIGASILVLVGLMIISSQYTQNRD